MNWTEHIIHQLRLWRVGCLFAVCAVLALLTVWSCLDPASVQYFGQAWNVDLMRQAIRTSIRQHPVAISLLGGVFIAGVAVLAWVGYRQAKGEEEDDEL